MIEAKRKDNESTNAFLRRFQRKIQTSRILMKARKARFAEPNKSKRRIKEGALRRANLVKEKERLFKLGKINEYEYKRGS